MVKIRGAAPDAEKRCGPPECIGANKRRIEGKPNRKHVGTSNAERRNLTVTMAMRRFERLTNALSKKLEKQVHMVAFHTVWCNFVKQHKSLKGLSPAMAAGIGKTPWSMEDIVEPIDAAAPGLHPRGPYQSKNTN